MTTARKAWIAAVIIVALITGSALWLVATESGLRWLAGIVDDRLPDQLSLGPLRGSLVHGIDIGSLEWHGEGLALEINEISVAFELLPLAKRQLLVESLTVERLRLEMSEASESAAEPRQETFSLPIDIELRTAVLNNIEFARGDLHRSVDRIAVSGDLEGDRLSVARLELRSSWLDLDVSGTGRLVENVPLDARARWRWKQQDTLELSGRLEATGDLASYTIYHDLDAPLSITTTGEVAYLDATLEVDLVNEWTALQWPLQQGMLHASGGTLRLAGRSDRFTLSLDTGVRLDEGSESRIRLSGTGRLTPAPRFDLDYAIAGLDPSLLDDRLNGALDASGTLALAMQDDAPEVTLGVDDLGGQLNGHVVDGRAAVTFANGQTSVSDATLRVGENSITGKARFGDTLQVRAEIDFADLGDIIAAAGGSVRGRMAMQGSLERPQVELSMQGAELAWQNYGVTQLTAEARIEGDQQGTAEVIVEGAAIASARLDFGRVALSGRPENHELRMAVRAYGTSLELEGRATYAEPGWTADLQRMDIANEKVGTWSTTTESRLELGPEESRLQRTCLAPANGAGQTCVSASRDVTATSVDIDIEALPLAALPIAVPSGITLEGLINASLRAAMTAEDLTAKAELGLDNASLSASYDGEQVSLRVATATGKVSFIDGRLESSAEVRLKDNAGSARAQLTVAEAGADGYPVDGNADIRINDASVFAVFMPSIDEPRGRIEGGLNVAGDASAPEFVGEIRFVDGAFSVRQTGIEVTDLNVRIAQSQPGQMQLSGSARSGDGDIEINGITRVSQEAGVRSEIWLRGDDFELARLPDWQISVSPTMTAIFDNDVTTIVGELAIPTANVTLREIPETAQTASSDATVHRPGASEPERRRRIDLHLRTSLGDDVQFAGFGLTTGLEGALQLRGGTHAPFTGQGRLGLIGGRYEAYGQRLEIERGSLIFTGPLDEPLLDIRAVRRTPEVIAGVQLTGTPSRLQSSLFSEPALGDAEALSYLLTGRPLSSSTTSDEGDTLNKAAFALGLSGAGLITSQIRSQLGLETLTIEGTADDSRLVAGKRLGDRLLVEYGYGLVDQLGTLLLRYELNERLMLESRTGTVSYLDLLYRARKR